MRVRNISKKVKGYMKIHRKQSYRKNNSGSSPIAYTVSGTDHKKINYILSNTMMLK